jgi:hypothetical protein
MIQNDEKVEGRIIIGGDYQEFRAWGSGLSFRRLPA